MTTYQTSETIRLTATITNTAGTAVDPTTVTITIENAQGIPVVEAASMTNSATGSYYYDYDIPSINNSRINIKKGRFEIWQRHHFQEGFKDLTETI